MLTHNYPAHDTAKQLVCFLFTAERYGRIVNDTSDDNLGLRNIITQTLNDQFKPAQMYNFNSSSLFNDLNSVFYTKCTNNP